jgi:hypothetical protein
MATPRASIVIAAPAARVWEVLTALHEYPAWAPFTVAARGRAEVGQRVAVAVEMTPGAALREQVMTVTAAAPPRLAWTFTLLSSLLLHAEREQTVEATGAAACTYSTSDTMTGLLAPLVLALYGASIEQGFASFARALKARAEEGAAARQ